MGGFFSKPDYDEINKLLGIRSKLLVDIEYAMNEGEMMEYRHKIDLIDQRLNESYTTEDIEEAKRRNKFN